MSLRSFLDSSEYDRFPFLNILIGTTGFGEKCLLAKMKMVIHSTEMGNLRDTLNTELTGIMWIVSYYKSIVPNYSVSNRGEKLENHGSRKSKFRLSRITKISMQVRYHFNNLFLHWKASVSSKRNLERLQFKAPYIVFRILVMSLSKDDCNHSAKRTHVSKSHRIQRWNHEYRLVIQVFRGPSKTFRSRITKNNFLNSLFTENKIS